ncbi:DUF1150 family protein [Rhizosaccharibacter radicis]|uniref:DUF1150 domain-containing protein n=1 Tax=Rhizosaccharibacter radicis TaxID=2782605 RepID=A0ABT1VWH8_9PROT|nr:DUF1150 domain-containing protein [Acetobacteraceae bacterium KSS12]
MNSSSSRDAFADGMPIDIRHLSTRQLQALGVSQLAYVKSVLVDGEIAFAIHAADGTPMALAGDREVAVAAIQQHEMVAASVH